MDPQIQNFVTNLAEWCICGVIGFVGTRVVSYLKSINDSIVELNKQVSIILAKSEWHEKRLDAIEEKLVKEA